MNLLSEFKEGLGISWSAIRANKMRSVLTTLGIVIGIVTVTLMGTAIEGLNRAFLKSISFIGADVLYIHRFEWFMHGQEEWLKAQKRRSTYCGYKNIWLRYVQPNGEVALREVRTFEAEPEAPRLSVTVTVIW